MNWRGAKTDTLPTNGRRGGDHKIRPIVDCVPGARRCVTAVHIHCERFTAIIFGRGKSCVAAFKDFKTLGRWARAWTLQQSTPTYFASMVLGTARVLLNASRDALHARYGNVT